MCLSFSVDSRFFASKAADGTVRLWRTDSWEVVAILKEFSADYVWSNFAFHTARATTLATFGDENRAIHTIRI